MATLLYELALTRIFSVLMWYHFASMAISLALFGMGVAALTVYLRPAWFPRERTDALCARRPRDKRHRRHKNDRGKRQVCHALNNDGGQNFHKF